MENKLVQLLTQYGRVLQQCLFPRLEEGMGPPSDKHQQVVRVLGLVILEAMLPYRGRQVGRPPQDRAAIARAFVAKAVYNLRTTKALLDLLAADVKLRRICGWERHSEVPDEATFSRAFGEFARTELPQRVHEALRWNGPILPADGYTALDCRPRLLPLTVKSRLPVSPSLIRAYLRSPFKPLGKQMLIRGTPTR